MSPANASPSTHVTDYEEKMGRERAALEKINSGIDGKQGAVYYTREICRRQRKIKMLELLKEVRF